MHRVVLDVSRRARVSFAVAPLHILANEIVSRGYPRALRGGNVSISLVFVSDREMSKLNAMHRGKKGPTDVLSFSFLEGEGWPSDGCLGEIIISVDTLRRQAREQKHRLADEARVLFTHGLLHILGYDHETPDDLKDMAKEEQKYLGDKAGLITRMNGESKMGSQQKRKAR